MALGRSAGFMAIPGVHMSNETLGYLGMVAGLGGFYCFPLISFGFFRFPSASFGFLSKGGRKEKKIQGKHKPIKESLRRL